MFPPSPNNFPPPTAGSCYPAAQELSAHNRTALTDKLFFSFFHLKIFKVFYF